MAKSCYIFLQKVPLLVFNRSLKKPLLWKYSEQVFCLFKDALSGLRQLLATEWKNAIYFTLKAFFLLKMFKSLSWHFGHVEIRIDSACFE